MKIAMKLLAVLCAALACALAHAAQLDLSSESEVTIRGRLMSPSGGWGWGLTRAGVITIRDGSGAVVAEKIWQSANSGGENYVSRDTTVTNATVSVPLALVVVLPAGTYTVSTTGSYSQGSWGYLWIEVAVSSSPSETWSWVDYSITGAWSEWSPDSSTVPAGQPFTQTRTRSVEDRKKEISSTGNERGDQHVGWRSETESRGATGAQPIATTFAFGALAHTYDGSPKAATVTASPSNATFTASLAAGPAAGTYTVSATANGSFSGSGSATLTISPASQSINFAAISGKTYGDAPFAVSATATSGLPVSFSIISGPATISGSTVTLIGSGTVTIRASQAGNTNWNAATNVDRSFTVPAGAPALTLNVASLDFGNVRVNAGSPLTSTITFRITNTGYGPLTVSAITFGNTDYTVIGLNGGAVTYPRTLNPAEILDVTVMFNPSQIGARNTTMTIVNNTATPNALTTVTGLGQDPQLKITWGPVRSIP